MKLTSPILLRCFPIFAASFFLIGCGAEKEEQRPEPKAGTSSIPLPKAPSKFKPEVEEPPLEFEAAMALFEEKGDESRARVRASLKAFLETGEDKSNLSEAHLWLATDLFQSQRRLPPNLREETNKRTEEHLTKAIGFDRSNEQAHRILSNLYLRNREAEKAITHLEGALEDAPGLIVLLAWLQHTQGDKTKVPALAGEGSRYWEAVVAKDPADYASRIRWARAESLLGNEDRAAEIIEEGQKLEAVPALNSFLNGMRQQQIQRYLSTEPPQVSDAIKVIEGLLATSPKNQQLIRRLSAIGNQHPDHREEVRAVLNKLIASTEASPSAHQALGEQWLQEADPNRALPHLEKAHELAPENPIIAMTLASTLTDADSIHHERALQVMDKLPKTAKGNPRAQRIRGRILLELERYDEGAEELERALAASPAIHKIEIHKLLNGAYEALDEPTLAADQRKLALDLEKQLEEAKQASDSAPSPKP